MLLLLLLLLLPVLVRPDGQLSASEACVQRWHGKCVLRAECPQVQRIGVCDAIHDVCCGAKTAVPPPPLSYPSYGHNESVPLYDMSCRGNVLAHIGELWTYTGVRGEILALVPQFYPTFFDCHHMNPVHHLVAPQLINVSVAIEPYGTKVLQPDGHLSGAGVLTDTHVPMLFSPQPAFTCSNNSIRAIIVSIWIRVVTQYDPQGRLILLMAGEEPISCSSPVQADLTACLANAVPLRQYHYSAESGWPCEGGEGCHFICPQPSNLVNTSQLSPYGLCLTAYQCERQGGYAVEGSESCTIDALPGTTSCTQTGCCLYRPPLLLVAPPTPVNIPSPTPPIDISSPLPSPNPINNPSPIPVDKPSPILLTPVINPLPVVSPVAPHISLPVIQENISIPSAAVTYSTSIRESARHLAFTLFDLSIFTTVLAGIVLTLCLASCAFLIVRRIRRRQHKSDDDDFVTIQLKEFIDLNQPNRPRRYSDPHSGSEIPVLLDDEDSLREEISAALKED